MVGILPNQWNTISEGPSDYVAKILGLDYYTLTNKSDARISGKTYLSHNPQNIEKIISTLHRSLNIEKIDVISNSDSNHKIITIFPDKISPMELQIAKRKGTDLIISPFLSPLALMELKFYELSYIQIPFHTIVESSLKRLCSILATEFPRKEFTFYPSDLILRSHSRKQNH